MIKDVDHRQVVKTIADESGLSPRYAFMTLMSAGIAILGLLISSPAVVIGAMLISPLMNPILGLGFALATFDFAEARRSLVAVTSGALLAVAFAWLIVTFSPLKAVTAEILSRTRPDLFDLLIALFAALAGTYAIIKGRGSAIVGVAIATALMPPLAVVGYGLATRNAPVMGGALALFVTNFVTIALSGTIMARLYGFGRSLSARQSWLQTALLAVVFAGLAVPLGLSLSHIASEALTVTEVRQVLFGQFGKASRLTQLTVDFDAEPLVVRAVVLSSRSRPLGVVQAALARKLGRRVDLQLDQVQLVHSASSLAAQRKQLQSQSDAAATAAAKAETDAIAHTVAMAAGIPPKEVLLDPEHKRALARAVPLPGATLDVYRTLEQRAASAAPGWAISIVPPIAALPMIRFASGSDVLDQAALRAVLTSAWAARRWNSPSLGIPGLPSSSALARPLLRQRRALAIAKLLHTQDIESRPLPAVGSVFRLSLTQTEWASRGDDGRQPL